MSAQTTPPAQEPASTTTWEVSLGADYSAGDYNASSDTTVLSVPLMLRVQLDRVRLEATVPYLHVDGPGTFAGGIVVPGHSGTTTSRSRTKAELFHVGRVSLLTYWTSTSVWRLNPRDYLAPSSDLTTGHASALWKRIMRIIALPLSLSAFTLSASAADLGSAAPLSIQQLDRQKYVPRLPNAPGPQILREAKNRVENFGRSLPFSQKVGKTKNITGFQFQLLGVPCSIGFEGTETYGAACGRNLGGK